jgi:hypothetical protein
MVTKYVLYLAFFLKYFNDLHFQSFNVESMSQRLCQITQMINGPHFEKKLYRKIRCHCIKEHLKLVNRKIPWELCRYCMFLYYT